LVQELHIQRVVNLKYVTLALGDYVWKWEDRERLSGWSLVMEVELGSRSQMPSWNILSGVGIRDYEDHGAWSVA